MQDSSNDILYRCRHQILAERHRQDMQIAARLPQWEGREPERASSDHNLSISIGVRFLG
jgi:hypothetical protein